MTLPQRSKYINNIINFYKNQNMLHVNIDSKFEELFVKFDRLNTSFNVQNEMI